MVSFDSIIIYLRKSRSDDPAQTVEEVLAKHERILQDYCMKEYGKAIPEKRIYREVVSGETIQDRPVMQQLLK
ncbi:MAG TPA: recombinase family protein, partial [Eubacterium sp.]|nr:recombinase family protein [Eubacterium sp.]